MSVTSRTGRRFSMNIIDDCTNYVWSLPLRTKDEVLIVLRDWLTAVENQSGQRLTYLVTDNGELASHQMSLFCSERGITHLFTAPYTSAHNGRAERLHRTLADKSRTMQIACSAPPNLWDEFSATAAFLTNLTVSSSLHGRTPYELWFGRLPSLSHLRKIGCRAFALVNTHNPKLNPRSVPCILIGYGSRSKAYRLWDPTSNRIFDSFHVSFIEHLDASPSPLYPNTTAGSASADQPGSWDSPLYSTNSSSDTHAPQSIVVPPASPTLPPRLAPIPYIIPPLPPRASHDGSATSSRIPYLHNNQIQANDTLPPHNVGRHPHLTTDVPSTTIPRNIPSDTRTYDSDITIDHPITTPSHNNTVIPQHTVNPNNNTVISTTNNTVPATNQPMNNPSSLLTHSPFPPPGLPHPPPLRRSSRIPVLSHRDVTADGLRPSSRLAAIKEDLANSRSRPLADRHYYPSASDVPGPVQPSTNTASFAYAFLSEYSPIRETHDLFHLPLLSLPHIPSVNHALLSLADGSLVPTADSDDDPLWAKALTSSEREYWIAGARDEIRSLEDLQVFVLVPRVTALPGCRCIGVSSEGLVPRGICGVGPGVTPVLMSGVEVIGV
jgi:hypothetical protein